MTERVRTDIDDVVARLRAGVRLRASSHDADGGRTFEKVGDLWFEDGAFRIRLARRIHADGAGFTPTAYEDRTLTEAELRARLASDPELRALAELA